MRPVSLVAQGFAAFRERVDINFEDADFFALVGPTGSGKSSVIDALCFALYGSVARYDNRNAVAPVITIGALEAKVSLTFDLGGERYIATRVVRRNAKGASTKEARLERAVEGGTEVVAGNVDELDAEVVRLLGLPFEHFTRCVVLPQGEFARFLHDKPSQRQELLVRLLGVGVHGRMGEAARRVADERANRVALHRERIERLAFATDEAEATTRTRLGRLEALGAEIGKVAPGVEALEREVAALEVAATTADALVDALERVTVPAQVAEFNEQLAQLRSGATAAAAHRLAAEEERRSLEERAQELPDVSELRAAVRAHDDLASCDVQLAELKDAADAATAAEERTAAALDDAIAAADAADAAVVAAQQADAAASVATLLVEGEPCPVCLQVVDALPHHGGGDAVRQATRVAERARKTRAAAEKEHAVASRNVATAAGQAKALGRHRAELAERVAAHPDRAALHTRITEVQVAAEQLDAARRAEDRLRRAEDQARVEVQAAERTLQKAWQLYDQQRDPLVAAGAPAPGRDDLLADWDALSSWAADERPRQVEASEQARKTSAERQGELHRRLDELIAACTDERIVIAADAPLAAVRDAVVRAEAQAGADLRRIQDARAEAAELDARVAADREEAEVARTLGQLLSAKGFERWLVGEALDALVDGASATLERLSGGQYALRRDATNQFLVVDHRNADETRSVKTLSGGETFQASLALALALADQLSGLSVDGGARLESIFLDEGFGTLDPESLSTVADTIEALGSYDRMVGIVTHVRELAERVPVRFEVAKGGRTSTVERTSS